VAEAYTILGTQRHSLTRGTKLTIRNFTTICHKNKTWQLKALVDIFVLQFINYAVSIKLHSADVRLNEYKYG
jgi:hypothetical protein